MYQIRRTTQFKKDIKRVLQRGKDFEQLLSVVKHLAEGDPLDAVYHDHPLKGQYQGKRDCHLAPDWILIYAFEDQELVLYRTGSHSDLFR
ncbi:MAG: type II toxin-antitoxin system YafQ family toxin [Chlorobiaceae bacterium]|nr:type II toxin-antitoxin system YafQ family toxin [Chlorobiaceae bacterium]